jgi:hypothetical protein
MRRTTALKMFVNFEMQMKINKLIKCLIVFALVPLLDGCETTEQAYFNQEAVGNAWATTLPKGSRIIVSNPLTLAPAFSEIKDGELVQECVLVSKEYLNKRDQHELEQLYLIETLKVKKDAP